MICCLTLHQRNTKILTLKKSIMRKSITFVAALLTATFTFSQTMDNPFSIGVHSGLVDYHGDLNQEWFNMGAYNAHIGLSGMYSLSPWLNTGIMVNYGSIGYHMPITSTNTQKGFRADMLHANAQLRLKFNNGTWLAEESRVQPYIYVGTGLSSMMSRTQSDGQNLTVEGTDWTGNAGLGVTYKVTELIGINYNFNYAMTNHDKRDNLSNGYNDQFMQHSLGLTFDFGNPKKLSTPKVVDSDGDGVGDDWDRCPQTAKGVKVDRHGCPVVDKETRAILDDALKGILFETGSDVLVASSHSKLDKVADLMKANPKYNLAIDGHTDNTGGTELNHTLSHKRADAVKAYLVSKGINESRMTTKGFGESQPVKSNNTEEGRAENRRVELIVIQ